VGTNYYFKPSRTEEMTKFIQSIPKAIMPLNILESLDELLSIHIGKISGGWKPLFAKTKYYDDFKQLRRFYEDNKEDLVIVDEYGAKYDWKDFMLSFVYVNPVGKSHMDIENFDVNIIINHYYYEDIYGYEWSNFNFK
jgi:hypothetical protein